LLGESKEFPREFIIKKEDQLWIEFFFVFGGNAEGIIEIQDFKSMEVIVEPQIEQLLEWLITRKMQLVTLKS